MKALIIEQDGKLIQPYKRIIIKRNWINTFFHIFPP
jgi:hypothetical protein